MTNQPDTSPQSDTAPPDGTVEHIADPRRRFVTPGALLCEPGISDAEKLAMLQEWEAAIADRPDCAAELEGVHSAIKRQARKIGQAG